MRVVTLLIGARATDAHRVIGWPPLDHIYAIHRQYLLQLIHGVLLLDHDCYYHVIQGLDILGRACLRHVGKTPNTNAVQAVVSGRLGAHGPHAGANILGRAAVNEQDALESGADRPLGVKLLDGLIDLDHS